MNLLVLAVMAALVPTGEDWRLQLDFTGDFTVAPFWIAPADSPNTGGHSLGGGGGAGLSLYPRGVIDDDAPPPLQPFLQRAAHVWVAGAGGASDYTHDPPDPDFATGTSTFSLDGGAEGYLGRRVYLSGAIGFGQTTSHFVSPNPDATTLTLAPRLALGVRFGDVLVTAGWSFTGVQIGGGDWSVPFWGGVWLGAHAVLRRSIDLGARVSMLDGGAGLSAGATFWVLRRLGLSLSLDGSRGATSDGRDVTATLGGSVGAQLWCSSKLAVALSYGISWLHETPPGLRYDVVGSLLGVTMTGRPF